MRDKVQGNSQVVFTSHSLEEEGEVLFCHSEQREETPLRGDGDGKNSVILNVL